MYRMANFLSPQPSAPTTPSPEGGEIRASAANPSPAHNFHTKSPAISPQSASSANTPVVSSEPVFHRRPSKLLVEYYAITFLFLIACVVLGAYVLLQPKILHFRSTNDEIGVQLKETENARAYLVSLEASIAAASSIPPDALQRVNEALPKKLNIPKLLQTMDEIARMNNVDIGSIQFSPGSPQPSSGSDPFAIIPVQTSLAIEASGYRDMKDFLTDLETNVRLIDIHTISVNGGSDGRISYAIQMTTYSLGEPIQQAPSSIPMNDIVPGPLDI